MAIEQGKQTPYLFYGQTLSLCAQCLALVPANILLESGSVFYQKRYPQHGVQKTKVSTDVTYFKQCQDDIKPGDRRCSFSPVRNMVVRWTAV